ncbi:MAG: HEAT repeat domain-containing protein [Bradymonadales bacterium]|nr:HEAT repeat domain-containing protein [Bradymonadales bacterium]
MPASEELIAFARSLYGPISSRAALESLDLASLAGLKGTELLAAELMLREKLEEREEDPRVPPALRQIGSSTAIEAMKKALDEYRCNYTRVALAAALWKLVRFPDAIRVLKDCVKNASNPTVRSTAAFELAQLDDSSIDSDLATVMATDDDQGVRLCAASALYQRHGVEQYRMCPPPELAAVHRRLLRTDAKEREAALAEFRALAAKLCRSTP